MKTVILTVVLIAVGTLAAAFISALTTSIHPEQQGLINRMATFGWRYGLAAGGVAAALFLIMYRDQLFR